MSNDTPIFPDDDVSQPGQYSADDMMAFGEWCAKQGWRNYDFYPGATDLEAWAKTKQHEPRH